MPTLRVPLVGSLTSRDDDNTRLYGSSQKDQYFKNCAFQIVENSISGKISAWVMGRNDYQAANGLSGAPATGNGTAIRKWRGHASNHLMSAFGSTNSTIYRDTTSISAITGQCIHMNETALSGVPNLLMVSGSNRAYYYDTVSGTISEITDADFPPNQGTPLTITGNFAVLDGYHFIMCTNGQIWHSDVNSVANWTSTATITAQEYPDPGVGLVRYKNMIVACSKSSIEFFVNGGNAAGAVLNRVQHMASRIGVLNQHCILEYGDSFIVVGVIDGVYGVFMFNGSRFDKISTEEIDWAIAFAGPVDLPRINLFSSWGKTYLGLQFGDNATSILMYDFDGHWGVWGLTNAVCKTDVFDRNYHIGSTVGYPLHNSTTIVSGEIQTARIDMDTTNRKTLNRLRVVGDKTTDALSVSVSWTDDDYQTYSTARTVNMSEVNPQLRRCGTFRRRSFKITGIGQSASGRPARLEALELDYTGSVL